MVQNVTLTLLMSHKVKRFKFVLLVAMSNLKKCKLTFLYFELFSFRQFENYQ